jgi:DNA primase
VAGRIRQDDIESVRERTDIVKVISQYLTLRKAGHDSLVGLCPFHTEKTPSFSVSPTKQVYYCFGCQAGGDAVRFMREVENLTFTEAIERLARDAGITLRYEAESPGERRAQSRRQSLHRANAEAAEVYHRTLLEGREAAEARAYLAGRGFDQDAVPQFQIGYAPGYPDFLLRRLSPRFGSDILVEAGLALKDATGAVRDRFRGRITFPVHDLSGQAVGMGARLVASVSASGGASAEGQPKYLNSPETPIYRKGKVLYNLNRAKGAVTRSGQAIVVEGYTDVIALARAGVETAVATCGTALGEEHFQLLSRFAQRVVLAFDSDDAGARAAERAYQFHETYPLQTRVLVLPEGLDPADFVRVKGGEAFQELAGEAVPLVEYMLDRSLAGHDLRSVEGRARGVREGLPIVAGLQDPVRREEYAHLLADRAGVSSSAVLLELERAGDAGGGAGAGRPDAGRRMEPEAGAATPARVSPQDRVERQMLRMLAQSDEVFEAVAGDVSDEHFERAQHRRLFELLVKGRGDVRSLVAELDDERLSAALAALATGPVEGELTVSHARRLALGLQENLLKRRIAELRKRLQRLNPLTSPEYEQLFEELIGLEEARRRAHEQAEGI